MSFLASLKTLGGFDVRALWSFSWPLALALGVLVLFFVLRRRALVSWPHWVNLFFILFLSLLEFDLVARSFSVVVPPYIDIDQIQRVGFILVLGWSFWCCVRYVAHQLEKSGRYARGVSARMVKLFQLFLFACLGLIVLGELGMPLSGVLAFGGAGAIVVGLSVRELFSEAFNGLMIHIDDTFSVCDFIKVGDVQGRVEAIGWLSSRIRSSSDKVICVPNSFFASRPVEIKQQMDRLFSVEVSLRYEDHPKLSKVMEALRQSLLVEKLIKNQKVYLMGVSDRLVTFRVEIALPFMDSFERCNFEERLLFGIISCVEKEEARIGAPVTLKGLSI